MARVVAALATLPSSTELRSLRSEPLANSSEWCSGPRTQGRRWWIVDLDPRSTFADTRSPSYRTPDKSAVDTYAPRSPLHVAIDYDAIGRSEGWNSRRIIDAIPGRYLVFATAVSLYVLGPSDLTTFSLEQRVEPKVRGANTLVTAVFGGIAPAGDVDGLAPGGESSMDASCTLLFDPTAPGAPSAVVIPGGARTLQIYDSTGAAWQWSQPTIGGNVPTTGGVSPLVAVPNCLAIAPSNRGTARTCALVFGVHL